MLVKQVSVFLDNKPGRIYHVTKILADHGVNIRALYVADTTDYGILRMIVDDDETALACLKDGGFTATVTPVFAVVMKDVPGGLYQVLLIFKNAGVGIEYMYAFSGRNEKNEAAVVLKVSDVEKTQEIAAAGKIKFLTQEEIGRLCL